MSVATSTLEAYARWAPVYPPSAHNPLMRAEQRAMLEAWPNMVGLRVLDLACGSGRYSRLLREAGTEQVVAVDFCMPMLEQVSTAGRVCASMMMLPFPPAVFDAVVCGLAVGHAADIERWVSEISRVLRPGGALVYSDFHADAVRAGMTRSFKDADAVSWTLPHQVYDLSCQKQALAAAGLTVETIKEVRLGLELNETFPGSDQVYGRWHGVPIVLIVRARKA